MTVTHSLSNLLTQEENQRLVSLLGHRKRIMATAVVQLFFAEPPYFNSWSKLQCGVATMTKDAERRSYFIQFYDLTVSDSELPPQVECYDSKRAGGLERFLGLRTSKNEFNKGYSQNSVN